MVTIRCTRKLLERIGSPSPLSEPSTTILGDWYAAPVAVGHQRLVLLISERSRLPVILPGRDVKHLAQNFPDVLALVLLGLGIPFAAVKREVDEMLQRARGHAVTPRAGGLSHERASAGRRRIVESTCTRCTSTGAT